MKILSTLASVIMMSSMFNGLSAALENTYYFTAATGGGHAAVPAAAPMTNTERPMTNEQRRGYLNRFANMGHEWAISYNMDHLREYGTPEERHCFIEYWAAQDNPKAIHMKVAGLKLGLYGYKKDPAAARQFIEALVAKDNQTAIEIKVDELWNAANELPFAIYENVSKNEAHDYLETHANLGNPEAIQKKVTGIESEAYGYDYEIAEADIMLFNFIEYLASQENEAGIELKAEGLAKGRYGYPEDPVAARRLIDDLVERRIPEAIRIKVQGLLFAMYGYGRDEDAEESYLYGEIILTKKGNPKMVCEFLKDLLEQNDPTAIELKAEDLLFGKYGYNVASVAEMDAFINSYFKWPEYLLK